MHIMQFMHMLVVIYRCCDAPAAAVMDLNF
jgi:hypothetical protein